MVYEFDACNDGLGGLKHAVKSYWAYPKKAYTWYKAAEVHTKQRFRLPIWVFIPVLAVALGVVFIPRAYSVLTHSIGGKSLQDPASGALAPVIAAPVLDARTFSTTVIARGYFNHGLMQTSPAIGTTMVLRIPGTTLIRHGNACFQTANTRSQS